MKSSRFRPSFSGGEYLPEAVPSPAAAAAAPPATATALLPAASTTAFGTLPAGGTSGVLDEPIAPAEPRRAERPDMARWRSPFGAVPVLDTLPAAPLPTLLLVDVGPALLLPAEDKGTVLLLSGEDMGGDDDGELDAGDTLEPVASDAAAAAAAFLFDRSDRIFTRLSEPREKQRGRGR